MATPPAAPQRAHEVDPFAPEKELLEGFLDWYRQAVISKVSGLGREQATRRQVPTPTTLLGIVKHLAYVERAWFQVRMDGKELPVPWPDEDPDADFRIEPAETVEGLIAFYRESIAASKAVAARYQLDDRARDPRRKVNLRWIMVHMIEETARHAGHADILRELIDGQTGR
jgi:uncharacterized damage-inducible protein DinB